MHIGVLQCDSVTEKLIATHGDYPEMFAKLLRQTNSTPNFKVYDVRQGQFPLSVDECDAYLISGSRHGVDDNLYWISMLEDFVHLLHIENKKLIGICFGHQLITKAFGGKVIKSPKHWGIGISTNKIIQQKPWMSPETPVVRLIVSHQDQVVELPKNAQLLASSDFCPFYMLEIGTNILTIQGHPEYSKAYVQALIENRKQILGDVCYEQGLQSLQLNEDSALLAQWMINFMTNKITQLA